jgi:MEKHLA domain
MRSDPREILEASAGARLALIADSFEALTGQALVAPGADLWTADRAILAHGTEDDPLFFYGNRLTLDLFDLTPRALIGMPSRLSAEAPDRAERARLLEAVSRNGFIADYAGVRISATGRRFRIERATVWTLIDAAGRKHGQAAAFSHWTRLDAA